MKITLDYLSGPVLGHKRRCEILKKVLIDRGHTVDQFDVPDWLIVDYPKDQFPDRGRCKYRMVMGILPPERDDWAWYPLAAQTPNTLTGVPWLILDPKLADYRDHSKRDEVLVTCGGADPYYLTERIIEVIRPSAVVTGPNFRRPIDMPKGTLLYFALDSIIELLASYRTVICTWGMTVFESLYLGAKIYPITLSDDHADEAYRLGTMFMRKESISNLPTWMKETNHWNIDRPLIDLLGATRLCSFMERLQ